MGQFYEILYMSQNVCQNKIDDFLETVPIGKALSHIQQIILATMPTGDEFVNAINIIKLISNRSSFIWLVLSIIFILCSNSVMSSLLR